MTMVGWLLWAAIAANIACAIWNVVWGRRLNRLLDEIVAERAELLVKVHAANPPLAREFGGR